MDPLHRQQIEPRHVLNSNLLTMKGIGCECRPSEFDVQCKKVLYKDWFSWNS